MRTWVPLVVIISLVGIGLVLFSAPVPAHDVVRAAQNDYPYPTPESTSVPTDLPTETATEPTATTATIPTDITPTETITEEQQTPVPDQSAPPTPEFDLPTDAPSSEKEPPDTVFICQPYKTYVLRGVTTPYTQLLLKFDEWIVGGSISDQAGNFAVPLNMGQESPGEHIIAIVVRESGIVLATKPCTVPE